MSDTQVEPESGKESRRKCRTHGRMHALVQDVSVWIHGHRLAVTLSCTFAGLNIAMWIGFALAGRPLPLRSLRTSLQEFNLLHLLATLLLTRGILQLLVDTIALLVMFSIAETLLGRRRTLTAAFICTLAGTALGLLLCGGIAQLLQGTPVVGRIRFALSPLTLGVGAMMAASAFTRRLWRRRIRLIGYVSIIMVVMFSGNPGDYCLLAAAGFGHVLGALASKRKTVRQLDDASAADPLHWQLSTSYETRRVFAAIALVLTLGPIIAISSPTHIGPLSSLGLIMSPASPDDGKLASCLAGMARTDCFFQFNLLRVSMPGAVLRSLLPTAVMLIMTWGLYRGRRLAAWAFIIVGLGESCIAMLYYFVAPLSHAPQGLRSLLLHGAIPASIANVLLPMVFAIAVACSMRHFPIRTDAGRLRRGSAAVVIALAVCIAAYLGFGLLRPGDFRPPATWHSLMHELPSRFIPIGFLNRSRPSFLPRTVAASVVDQAVGLVFWLVVLVVAVRWMREILLVDGRARANAGRLVELDGESMSFMTTWEGNHYWFSATGRSAIAYRVSYGIALTTTGPFGDRGEWSSDLREFARFSMQQSWSPVLYSVHREQRDQLAAMGWYSLEVGSEMVVDPRQWKTTGKKWQDIRTAINKAKRSGISDVMSTFNEAPNDIREQIEEISEQWAQLKALPEMKFTLGGVEELHDPRVRILYAIDAEGTVLGVTSWLPTWRDGRIIGWTLDFMRHRTDSPNGIMEFLIARMAERLRDEGLEHPECAVEFMSLSAAPLAGMNPQRDNADETGHMDTGTVMLQHALQIVADWMEPAYGFHSLFNFKRKFQPTEEPVYICYPDPAVLAQIGLAVVRAYVPSLTAKEAMGMLRTLQR